jgi:hypothetical protein
MIRIRPAGIHRTDLGTLGRLIRADTLGAAAGIDDILGVPLFDCLVRALGFASPTTDAVIGYVVCHFLLLQRSTFGSRALLLFFIAASAPAWFIAGTALTAVENPLQFARIDTDTASAIRATVVFLFFHVSHPPFGYCVVPHVLPS